MKTNIFRISLVALAATFMASCSSDEVDNTVSEVQNEELTALTVQVADADFEAVNTETRVSDNGANTVFETGDQMGLYVIRDGEFILSNVALTYDADEASWSGRTIYYYQDATYVAYFPYNANVSVDEATDAATVITSIQSTFDTLLSEAATEQTEETYHSLDLMTASIAAADISTDTYALSFSFTHAYSMIELVIPYWNYSYTGRSGDTKSYSVYMKDVKINIAEGENTATAVTPCSLGEGVYRYLVSPGTVSISGSFMDPSDNAEITFSKSSIELAANNYVSYTINVTINGEARTYTKERDPQIGDLYLADGSLWPVEWSEADSSPDGTVLGFVVAEVGDDEFSEDADGNDVSDAYDYYVFAANVVQTKFNSTDNVAITGLTPISDAYSTTDEDDNISKILEDMDGLANTNIIKTNASGFTIVSALETNYPDTGLGNSEWFIPSAGQWAKIYNTLEDAENDCTWSEGRHYQQMYMYLYSADDDYSTYYTNVQKYLGYIEGSGAMQGINWSSTQDKVSSDATNGTTTYAAEGTYQMYATDRAASTLTTDHLNIRPFAYSGDRYLRAILAF